MHYAHGVCTLSGERQEHQLGLHPASCTTPQASACDQHHLSVPLSSSRCTRCTRLPLPTHKPLTTCTLLHTAVAAKATISNLTPENQGLCWTQCQPADCSEFVEPTGRAHRAWCAEKTGASHGIGACHRQRPQRLNPCRRLAFPHHFFLPNQLERDQERDLEELELEERLEEELDLLEEEDLRGFSSSSSSSLLLL